MNSQKVNTGQTLFYSSLEGKWKMVVNTLSEDYKLFLKKAICVKNMERPIQYILDSEGP